MLNIPFSLPNIELVSEYQTVGFKLKVVLPPHSIAFLPRNGYYMSRN